jgi:hypothetical protein
MKSERNRTVDLATHFRSETANACHLGGLPVEILYMLAEVLDSTLSALDEIVLIAITVPG